MGNIFKISNLKKTYYYLKRNGVMQTIGAALERVQAPYFADYCYVQPSKQDLELQRKKVWDNPVIFSIVVPAYETKEAFLQVLIEAMAEQTYPYWELVIADASNSDKVEKQCEKYKDNRIQYFSLKKNEGISENTNYGLTKATGDYVGLLDHDDYLTPDALFEMAKAIEEGKAKQKEYELLYSDEDKCDENATHFYEPHFKTDFNLDLFLTNNYICHFCVMKTELIRKLKFRKEYDGAQDYDIFLRAVGELWKQNPKVEENICHIPKVLYHWRCHNDSTAANPQSKAYAYDAGKRALQDFVNSRGWEAKVEELAHVGFYKIVYEKDIFAQREDVIAVGKKRIKRGKVVSGALDSRGKILYENLPFCYSGYIHRAVLAQNVSQLDMDDWMINPQYRDMMEQFLQETQLKKQMSKEQIQEALCEYVIGLGYRLYWDPRGEVV